MTMYIIIGAIQLAFLVVALIIKLRMAQLLNHKKFLNGLVWFFGLAIVARLFHLLLAMGIISVAPALVAFLDIFIIPTVVYGCLVIGFVQLYTTLRKQFKQLLIVQLENKKV